MNVNDYVSTFHQWTTLELYGGFKPKKLCIICKQHMVHKTNDKKISGVLVLFLISYTASLLHCPHIYCVA